MIVYLTTGIAALFYAWHVPIRVALALSIGQENRLKIGVGIFHVEWIYEHSIELSLALIRGQLQKRHVSKIDFRHMLPGAQYLLRHLEAKQARVLIAVGTGDAAETALLYGALQSAVQIAKEFLPIRIRSQIAPDFKERKLLLSAGGIVSVKLGHIIHALALIALESMTRRITHGTSSN